MANRVLSVVACAMVAFVGILIVWINLGDRSPVNPPPSPRTVVARPVQPPAANPPQQQPPEPASRAHAALASDNAPMDFERPLPEPSQPKEEPKRYTWAEVEQRMDELRAERKARPAAIHELYDWYARLANPAFTQSVDFPQHFERLATWRKEVSDSSTRLVVLARAYIEYAWRARGTGFADTVTDEGWELFHVRMSEARRLLDEAVKLGVKDGEAYRSYLIVARAEGLEKDQALLWLNEGKEIDPTYYRLYVAMAEYLLPRWHGEPGDIERFAAEVAGELSGDDGAEAFGQIAYHVNHYENPYSPTLFWGEYDRALLARAADVLAQRYPNHRPYVNFAALCAYVAQNHEVANRIRPHLGEFDEKDRIWVTKNSHKNFMLWCDSKDPGGEQSFVWGSQAGTIGLAFQADTNQLSIAPQFGQSAIDWIDLETGKLTAALPSPGGILNGVEFADGQRIVTSFWRGPFQGWILWDPQSLDVIRYPTAEQVRAMALHPAKPELAWAESKTVRFIRLKSRELLRQFDFPDYVHDLEFSEDGTLLIVRCGRDFVRDAATGESKFEEVLEPDPTRGQGDWMIRSVLGIDHQGRCWAMQSLRADPTQPHRLARSTVDGKEWEPLIASLPTGKAILSPDWRLLAVRTEPQQGNAATPIEVWDISSAKRTHHLPGHWNRIGQMVFSPDSKRLATVGLISDVIKIWSLEDVPESKVDVNHN